MDELCEPFVLYKDYPNGGSVWLMLGMDETSSDYEDILAIAECLAKQGHEVKILHAVHYKDPLYRIVFGELIGTKWYRKCPDLLVDYEFFEYESYKTSLPKKALRNMLHNGLAQAECLIIRQCKLTDEYILQQISGYIQNGISIEKILVFNGETVRPLYIKQ